MHLSPFALCFFCLIASYPALTQTPTAFQQQTQAAVSAGKPFSIVNLTATAEWTAGSLHQSGTAQLHANTDGSTHVELALGQASRTEVQTKADASRICSWIDGAGKSHNISGPNCFTSVPWFSPGLFTQPPAGLPTLLSTTDDGVVSKDGSSFHQVSFILNLAGVDSASTQRLIDQSKVKVFYDPQTFLPTSLEYFIHPEGSGSQNIPVRVAFSNYQSVSGVMLPFRIEKYVNRTLQLKLDVTNASIQ